MTHEPAADPRVRTSRVAIAAESIDPAGAFDSLGDDASGAQVLFVGVVRDHDQGLPVREIEYVAHPDAEAALRRIVDDCLRDNPEVRTVVAWHRTGLLAVGEVALLVATASPHRAEAMTACSDVIDRLKHEVPIWKRQVFVDGHHEWSNAPKA